MSDITLSAGVRQNLLSLQSTADMMAITQNRLATGKKVNSALDNPTNFFTASSLHARASDLGNLMDSMANGIKTIEAADNGISAITKVVENMQSLVRQARADKTGEGVAPGTPTTAVGNTSTGATDALTFDVGDGVTVSIATADGGAPKSLEDLAAEINSHSQLQGKVKATYDAVNGLSLENLTTSAIAMTGIDSGGTDNITGGSGDTGTLAAGTGAASDVRTSLQTQFSELRTQLDSLAADAGFNGINLLNGDELKLDFNETSTSSITIKAKDAQGDDFGAMSADRLGIVDTTDFGSDTELDQLSKDLQAALGTLRSQASAYGSNLTTVQNREAFTKNMINTLQTGGDNLVLADTNEEAANLLALQTRQQLSSTALSMASQADQAVLRLF